jgi:Nickel responsive protein SCO4226-like
LGSQIQWVQCYVTGDKIYWVSIAPTEAMVREHAQLGGFPANSVAQVMTMIDRETETLGCEDNPRHFSVSQHVPFLGYSRCGRLTTRRGGDLRNWLREMWAGLFGTHSC